MDAALVVDDVTRRYGDVVALDGVSLEVHRGEIFGLIGPNGAGKTTLVRALSGTTTPEAGTISVLGTEPGTVDPTRIGLLPQDFRPPSRLTARELLAYYAGLYDDHRAIDSVLAAVGMAERGAVRYDRLSGGQRRRVCVGIALVNDPDVLFLDEPTTGIDPAGRRALWELLSGLSADGTTIFLTTHDMAEAEALADRVGLLSAGRLIEVGPPAALVRAHGGDSRLIVETTVEPDTIDGIGDRATVDGSTVTIHGIDPREIGPVVDRLEAVGVEYDSLTWTEPTLEDVYLTLTGERFEPAPRPLEPEAAR